MKVYELIQVLAQHPANAEIRIIKDNDYQKVIVNIETIPISGRDVTIEIEE